MKRTQNNLCRSRVLDGIHTVWYSLKSDHFLFSHVCLSASAFEGLGAHETHRLLHITGTLVYFDFVLTVYDYRLLSQYLDFAGKAKPELFMFPSLLCAVCVCVSCLYVCVLMYEGRDDTMHLRRKLQHCCVTVNFFSVISNGD